MLNHLAANYELLEQFMMSNDGVELLDERYTVLNSRKNYDDARPCL